MTVLEIYQDLVSEEASKMELDLTNYILEEESMRYSQGNFTYLHKNDNRMPRPMYKRRIFVKFQYTVGMLVGEATFNITKILFTLEKQS